MTKNSILCSVGLVLVVMFYKPHTYSVARVIEPGGVEVIDSPIIKEPMLDTLNKGLRELNNKVKENKVYTITISKQLKTLNAQADSIKSLIATRKSKVVVDTSCNCDPVPQRVNIWGKIGIFLGIKKK